MHSLPHGRSSGTNFTFSRTIHTRNFAALPLRLRYTKFLLNLLQCRRPDRAYRHFHGRRPVWVYRRFRRRPVWVHRRFRRRPVWVYRRFRRRPDWVYRQLHGRRPDWCTAVLGEDPIGYHPYTNLPYLLTYLLNLHCTLLTYLLTLHCTVRLQEP